MVAGPAPDPQLVPGRRIRAARGAVLRKAFRHVTIPGHSPHRGMARPVAMVKTGKRVLTIPPFRRAGRLRGMALDVPEFAGVPAGPPGGRSAELVEGASAAARSPRAPAATWPRPCRRCAPSAGHVLGVDGREGVEVPRDRVNSPCKWHAQFLEELFCDLQLRDRGICRHCHS